MRDELRIGSVLERENRMRKEREILTVGGESSGGSRNSFRDEHITFVLQVA